MSVAPDSHLGLRAEAHKLRSANAQLRFTLAEKQARIDEMQLSAERFALEQDYRAALAPQDGHVFDWSTLTFIPPETPKQ